MKNIFFIFIIFSNINFAQKTWVKIYYDIVYHSIFFPIDIIENEDLGYTILIDDLYDQFFLIKVDSNGNIEWTRYNPFLYGLLGKINKTKDANYAIADMGGYCVGDPPYCNSGAILQKFDKNWNLIWGNGYGVDFTPSYDFDAGVVTDLKETSDSGYILIGLFNSFIPYSFILKTNSEGNMEWVKFYYFFIYFSAIEETKEGEFIILGPGELGEEKEEKIVLMKTNKYGELIWLKIYGGENKLVSMPFIIKGNSEGRYLISSEMFFKEEGLYGFYIFEIDEMGNILWQKKYISENFNDGKYSIWYVIKDKDGFVLVGTRYGETCSSNRIFALKIDFEGKIIWQKIYGEEIISGVACSLANTKDGGYIISAFGCDGKMILIKTNSNGNVSCKNFVSYADLIEKNINLQVMDGYTTFYSKRLKKFIMEEELEEFEITSEEICPVYYSHLRPF